MVSSKYVEDQLIRAGCKFQLWGRAEIKELCNVLMENEEIKECLNGHYEGGFALLCSTNQRILLIDKKPMFLTLEDVRYDMIAEIQYSHRLLDATVRVYTPTKSLSFTSWNRTHLRNLVMGAQKHVMEIRQYQNMKSNRAMQEAVAAVEPQSPAPQPTPLPQPFSQMTMPQQSTQRQSVTPRPVSTSSALSATAISGAMGLENQQDSIEFNSIPNPFLRAPLITRNRGIRSW